MCVCVYEACDSLWSITASVFFSLPHHVEIVVVHTIFGLLGVHVYMCTCVHVYMCTCVGA